MREEIDDGRVECRDLVNLLDSISSKGMVLVDELLDHANLTSVNQHMVEFEFGELVQEIIDLLDPRQECEIWHSHGRLYGDRTVTMMILRNLIDNAIKHARPKTGLSPDGSGPEPLRLWVELEESDEGFFSVILKDNGEGFSDPVLLFLEGGEFQAGSGFGLFGVRRLIHERGGAVSVMNRPNDQGAEIAFTLPKLHPSDQRRKAGRPASLSKRCEPFAQH